MSEPKLISPLLDNFAIGEPISDHHGVRCFPAMKQDSDEKYIVKIISVPASQSQLSALLLSGAYPDAEAADSYFKELSENIVSEITALGQLSETEGFLPYLGYQVVPMDDGVGYDIYLLSKYCCTLSRSMRYTPMTQLSALNLALDLCARLRI